MKLAESLGAETQTLTGTDLPAELLRFAKFENVTQIVVGRSRGGFLSELLRRSLPHELVRRRRTSPSIWSPARPMPPSGATLFSLAQTCRALRSFPLRGSRVAAALAVGELLTELTPIPNLSMVFLLAVLVTAMSFGIWPAIYASVLSFLVYNFFFIPPLYTFTIAEPYELLALVDLSRRRGRHLGAGRPRARAGEGLREPHAGDAAALRIHAPAVGARHARRRRRRRRERDPCKPRTSGGGHAGARRRSRR